MELVVVLLTALISAFFMALTGFGFGLIAMTIFPLVMPIATANVVTLALATVVCAVGIVPIRKRVVLDILWPVWVGSAVGIPLGVFYLVRLDESILRISLGVVILLAIAGTFLRRGAPQADTKKRSVASRLAGIGAGLLSGALGGAFSVGGPPIVLYLSHRLQDKQELKANLFGFFLWATLLRTPLLIATRVATVEVLTTSLYALPALAVGMVIGNRFHKRVDSRIVKRVIQLLLAVSATLMIVNAL